MAAVPPVSAADSASRWPSLAMVAGETSGDLLAGLLLDGLRARWPNLSFGQLNGLAL